MAHVKNHDYHILNPSLWPLMASVAAFIMLFGATVAMKGETTILGGMITISGPWMALIGFVGVLYVMFGWWADTVSENKAGDHTPVVLIGLRYGFILFIMSEVMFFAAWFWSFFKHAMYPMGEMSPMVDGVWPPVDQHIDPIVLRRGCYLGAPRVGARRQPQGYGQWLGDCCCAWTDLYSVSGL